MNVVIRLVIGFIIALVILCIICFVIKLTQKKKYAEAMLIIMKNNGAPFFIALTLICCYVSVYNSIGDMWDWSLILTIILTFLLGFIGYYINRFVQNIAEDAVKLTQDYSGLISKYPMTKEMFYSYDNSKKANDNKINYRKALQKATPNKKIDWEYESAYTSRFPVIVDAILINKTIVIKDCQELYKLPEEIVSYRDELFKAHMTSHVYNQLNIRVNDWYLKDNTFVLKTARTTYFDSLVTNRAIDFQMNNEMSVRNILQYGPFVPNLNESKLSNHLGFNGLIITSDRKIILVKRNGKMSIAKRTYGPSVGASMKTKYCLTPDGVLDIKMMLNAIKKEIEDELKIEEKWMAGKLTESNIIAAYRDVVEGNKPQLVFYAQLNVPFDYLYEHFREKMHEKAKEYSPLSKEYHELEDGDRLIAFPLKDFLDACISPGKIFVSRKEYTVVPSMAVSLAVFLEEYDKGDICLND